MNTNTPADVNPVASECHAAFHAYVAQYFPQLAQSIQRLAKHGHVLATRKDKENARIYTAMRMAFEAAWLLRGMA